MSSSLPICSLGLYLMLYNYCKTKPLILIMACLIETIITGNFGGVCFQIHSHSNLKSRAEVKLGA